MRQYLSELAHDYKTSFIDHKVIWLSFAILLGGLTFAPAFAAHPCVENDDSCLPASHGIQITNQETADDAGILPDHPLYGLDVALDRLALLLTFDKTDKARLGLIIASERLSEVQLMIEANKIAHAERTQILHDEVIDEAQTALEEIELDTDDAEEELIKKLEIEARFTAHEERIDRITEKIKQRINSIDNLPSDQKLRVIVLLNNIDDRVKIAMMRSSEETRESEQRVRDQTGRTDFELKLFRDEIREKIKINIREFGIFSKHNISGKIISAIRSGQLQTTQAGGGAGMAHEFIIDRNLLQTADCVGSVLEETGRCVSSSDYNNNRDFWDNYCNTVTNIFDNIFGGGKCVDGFDRDADTKEKCDAINSPVTYVWDSNNQVCHKSIIDSIDDAVTDEQKRCLEKSDIDQRYFWFSRGASAEDRCAVNSLALGFEIRDNVDRDPSLGGY